MGKSRRVHALLVVQDGVRALQAVSNDITAADDGRDIRADRDALQEGAARTAALLPPIRTHSRRPGRARSSRSLPIRLQAPNRPNTTDDMVIA